MIRNIALTTSPHETAGTLTLDSGQSFLTATGIGRLEWHIDDSLTGGANLTVVAVGHRTHQGRAVLPLGDAELAWELKPGGPLVTQPLTLGPAAPSGLSVMADRFIKDGRPFIVKGSTDFRLGERVHAGADIRPILRDRFDVGANWLRVLGMKKNNTGWAWDPRAPGRHDALRRLFDLAGNYWFYVQWCVFADTKFWMPNHNEQLDHYGRECDLIRQYPHVVLELCNEKSHTTQSINPALFPRPSGILASHGSETADKFPVRPLWDWAGYSARRNGDFGKVISNYGQLTAFEQWPPVCLLPQETIKPENYGHDPAVASRLGRCARTGTGGVFHHQAWNEPRVFNGGERACARAFFEALD